MNKDLNQCGTATFFFNNTIPYAAIPKFYLKDKELSLKAKGLLTILYSLPEDWNYNMEGLCKITGQSEKVIRNILKELERLWYLERTKKRNKHGQYYYEYMIKIEPFNYMTCEKRPPAHLG